MEKTSIHIKPCNVNSSEQINYRRTKLDHVTEELSVLNESWASDNLTLPQHLGMIQAAYKQAKGQRMQSKATPIREGVVVIQDHTTMEQLHKFVEECQTRWGIKPLQIHIHRDLGHISMGYWIPNPIAHIVWRWCDDVGITYKLGRHDMAEMQTLLASCLEMERGLSSDKKHLSAIQEKNEREEMRLIALQDAITRMQDTLQGITEAKALKNAYMEALRASITKHTSKTIIGGVVVNYGAVVADMLAMLSAP